MKIVVIGGTGRIGSMVVADLTKRGHDALAAAPETGVNTLTGEGLAKALEGASVVVDVANSPTFDDAAIPFFRSAGGNLLAAARGAGVSHHLALSVVGTERLLASGYFQAKLLQEDLIKTSAIPYTILRSTQFFPFVSGIVESGAINGQIHLSSAAIQPVSPTEVAAALAEMAVAAPANATLEIAGPEVFRLDRFAEAYMSAKGDSRPIVSDPAAPYFGIVLDDRSLTPGDHPRLGKETFGDWLRASIPAD
jgi:uncharacterized protein YbjT (DUF2867 family)